MHDLIVIGDDLSSHVAAAAAANYGLDTVLIAERGTGGIYLSGDFAFNIDPTPLSGFGVNQCGLSLLAELDIPPIEREGKLLNPAYQIILPEHRIDFFNEEEALVKEMAREFPAQAKEIGAFYESVTKKCTIFSEWLHTHPFIQPLNIKDYYNYLKLTPYLLLHQIERVRFKKLLARNPSLSKVFEAQQALLGIVCGHQSSFSDNFQYCAPFRGIYSFPQGKQIIFNSLIKKLEAKRGLYLGVCDISNVRKEKSIEIEVTDKAGNSSTIEAKYLIVSTKWEKMPLLLAAKKKINLGDWISPVKISHLPFTIYLGCAQKCIPEKMANHLAIVSDVQKNIFDNNLITLESSLPSDAAMTGVAKASLTATVFLPDKADVWSKENLALQASSIIDRLEFFLPFLKENMEYFDLEKSIELSKISRSVVSPKYKIKKSFITGFAARTNKTRFKNVYLTGASLLADAGFEGEILSGMNAASRAIGRLQKIT
jgi:phytoene dehydrogenase-like protein